MPPKEPTFEVESINGLLRLRVRRTDRAHTFRISPEAALKLARELYGTAVAALVKAAKTTPS
ncbi:MAG: hypothetical protein OXP74_06785 [Acidobacteriota bacterium]|nr:hypothetical protein [Acidobacteriota bacterium]